MSKQSKDIQRIIAYNNAQEASEIISKQQDDFACKFAEWLVLRYSSCVNDKWLDEKEWREIGTANYYTSEELLTKFKEENKQPAKTKSTITVKDNGNIKDFYFKTVLLGSAIKVESGHYSFKFKDNQGLIDEYGLRLIADKLDELNKDWNKYINKNLK